MLNRNIELLLSYLAQYSSAVLLLPFILGLAAGIKIRRWHMESGVWIVVGNGILIGLPLMHWLINNYAQTTDLNTITNDMVALLDFTHVISSLGFAAGLLCQLRGIWLLAKRCRELQHEN